MEQSPKHTRRADYVGIWWTLIGPGGVLVTAFSAIVGFFEPIAQHGWAAVVLAGCAAAGASVLVASAGMIGWRYFNPLPSARSSPIPNSISGSLSDEQINHMIDVRLDEFLATKLRTEFTTHSQSHGQDENIAALLEQFKDQRELIGALENQVARVIQYAEDHVRNTRTRFDWIDGGFRSIHHRERLTHFENKLAGHAAFLLSPRNSKPVEDWDEWNATRHRWQSDLDTWLELADVHRMGTSERVRAIKNASLEGAWAEDEFMPNSHDLVVAYRCVATAYDNYLNERDHVNAAVSSAAFNSPSKKGNPQLLKDEDR